MTVMTTDEIEEHLDTLATALGSSSPGDYREGVRALQMLRVAILALNQDNENMTRAILTAMRRAEREALAPKDVPRM